MGKKSSDKPFENFSCSEDILSLITIFSNKIGTLFFFSQTIPMVQPESGYGFDEKQSFTILTGGLFTAELDSVFFFL